MELYCHRGWMLTITVSTLSDKCYQVLTSDGDLSKIIYNGIVEYSFDESSIDLTKLDTLQKRALIISWNPMPGGGLRDNSGSSRPYRYHSFR